MDAMSYLESRREKYLDFYRATLRKLRDEGGVCEAEVCFDAKGAGGAEEDREAGEPICLDVVVEKEGEKSMAMITNQEAVGEVEEGPEVGEMDVRGVPVRVFSGAWEAMPVWVRPPEPDWERLHAWKEKWMVLDVAEGRIGGAMEDEDGLHGQVHYLGKAAQEGGGFVHVVDFGSAPMEALIGLLESLAVMGVSEIEVGRSDGTVLSPEVRERLREPVLSLATVAEVAAELFRGLPEVSGVEVREAGHLEVRAVGKGSAMHVVVDNLHRLLLRVGTEMRALEMYRFLRGQRAVMGPELIPELSQLRVVMKDDRFLGLAGKSGKMKALVRERLAGDLWVMCVWDQPNGMRFTSEEEAATFGMSAREMMARARANFVKARGDVELSEKEAVTVAQTKDCYDASLILDDAWCEIMEKRVEGELLACVPARHLVVLGGSGRAGTREQMRAVVERVERAGDHLISGTMLVRRGGKWEVDQEEAGPERKVEEGMLPTESPEAGGEKRKWRWRFWRK